MDKEPHWAGILMRIRGRHTRPGCYGHGPSTHSSGELTVTVPTAQSARAQWVLVSTTQWTPGASPSRASPTLYLGRVRTSGMTGTVADDSRGPCNLSDTLGKGPAGLE